MVLDKEVNLKIVTIDNRKTISIQTNNIMDKIENGIIFLTHNRLKYNNSKYLLCQNGSRLS